MRKYRYPSPAPSSAVVNLHAHTEPRAERPPKSVLFCPHCGHESPPTGDWLVRQRDGRRVYVCPDCAGTVTVRGDSDDDRAVVNDLVGGPADD